MNYTRLALSAVAAFVAYMGVGGIFFMNDGMKNEFRKYTSVFRTEETMKGAMPMGMLGMLLAMGAASWLFAMIHPAGAGWMAGAEFGFVTAVFVLGTYVLHNYSILNIGGRLAAMQGFAHTLQWIMVGVVIALVYRP